MCGGGGGDFLKSCKDKLEFQSCMGGPRFAPTLFLQAQRGSLASGRQISDISR